MASEKFHEPDLTNLAAPHPDINVGTSGSLAMVDWQEVEGQWRDNHASRPYVKADRGFDYYKPAYRYGHEAAARHQGREWHDVAPELEHGWDEARHGASGAWADVKDAIEDAWNHARGRGNLDHGIDVHHDHDAHRG